LRRRPDTGTWEASIGLPAGTETLDYQLLIKDDVSGAVLRRESSGNRTAELDPAPPDVVGVREILNAWEGVVVRFIIHHPTAPDHVLAVVGNHPRLGRWDEPRIMTLGPDRRLLTGSMGRCWELTVPFNQVAEERLDYRYLMVNQGTGTTIWEREPGRQVVLPAVSDAVNGVAELFDANFVGGMEFDAVPPAMFLGPYPQTLEDVNLMQASGVTAVLNVQTDADLTVRRVDWALFQAYYETLGINCYRLPIGDFDEEDLVRRLPEAVELLRRLHGEGKQVYVHCTAGMGRSPAVVVAYLSRYHGLDPQQALAEVRRHRRVVTPNMNAVRRFLQGEDR
jgi:protein-tyrosine phosphatase